MPSHFVRVASLALGLLACTSCSQRDQHGDQSRERRGEDTSSPPDISPTAAPGVAFNYDYEFSLPDERIAATQEVHAAACEKVGIEHCRITGMSYTVDQNEQVKAELNLNLDPLIARQFGKSVQQAVEGNDGKLVRLDIGSSDEGHAIEQAVSQKSDTSAQVERLQRELASTKPGSEARSTLISQIEALQQQSSQEARTIERSQAALANTPMEIHYYGRGGVPGFRANPLREAWQTLVTTVVWLVEILLQVLAILIPVALLGGASIALWRARATRAFRRWIRGPQDTEV
jgi:hypothetical protein